MDTSINLEKAIATSSALSFAAGSSTIGPGPLPHGEAAQRYRSTTGCNDTPATIIDAIRHDLCELDDTMSETSPLIM